LLHHAAQIGIVTGPVAVDMAKVRQRKRELVEGLVAVHRELYHKSGAELIMGDGRFVAPKTLEVRLRDGGTRLLTAERVFLNVGTRAVTQEPGDSTGRCSPVRSRPSADKVVFKPRDGLPVHKGGRCVPPCLGIE
jgi:pyruvate/2-oxoglutarate dehydrogenase complex dihydrolipoamide dehydrogenase (E3) component